MTNIKFVFLNWNKSWYLKVIRRTDHPSLLKRKLPIIHPVTVTWRTISSATGPRLDTVEDTIQIDNKRQLLHLRKHSCIPVTIYAIHLLSTHLKSNILVKANQAGGSWHSCQEKYNSTIELNKFTLQFKLVSSPQVAEFNTLFFHTYTYHSLRQHTPSTYTIINQYIISLSVLVRISHRPAKDLECLYCDTPLLI